MIDKKEFEIKDWKGNVFKDGDTIVMANFFRPQKMDKVIYKDPGNNQLFEIPYDYPHQSGFGWCEFWKSKVFDIDGVLHVNLPNGPRNSWIVVTPLKLCWDFHVEKNGGQLGNVFCIEGKSNNHEEFFRYYYRENMSGLN